MKADLQSMTRAELRAYMIAHPNDVEAFQLWVDHATANPPKEIYPPARTKEDIAEVERLIRERLETRDRKQAS